jgi:cation:H+ antiporter
MTVLSLIGGLVLLMAGGEALVKGSVAVAVRLGVSPLLIGLTLVGFGTSTPELVASLQAALRGSPGIAIGNIVGSNIANTFLILGLSAAILPIATSRQAFRRDGTTLVLASLVFAAVVLLGEVTRLAGLVFLSLLAAYTIHTYRTERRTHDAGAVVHEAETAEVEETPPRGLSLGPAAVLAAAGIAAVVFGADLLVGAAITVAAAADLSETVIGLTLVAVGTSLPELITSVMAAVRRHADVAFGNVIGSNIFNILGIAGVTATVSPIPVPAEIVRLDVWVMLGATLLLVLVTMTGWRISRSEGWAFLAVYGAYIAVQLSSSLRSALGLG